MPSFLRHLIATKGPTYALTRVFQVLRRFTFGGARLDRTISLVDQTLGLRNFPITFFVSSGTIKRHRRRIERMHMLGHDIGSHGVFHTRMDLKDFDTQLSIMNESHRTLTHAGFPVQGFRSPYLNYSPATRQALDQSPFTWTSGEVILWKNGLGLHSTVERLGPLYHFQTSEERLSLPRFRGRLLDIPITAPDDEILYERCGVRDTKGIRKAWVDVFDQIHDRGELFTVLIHAERFPRMHSALGALIDHVRSRKPGVWCTSLAKLADWWKARSVWRWERVEREWVKIDAPSSATLLIKYPDYALGAPVVSKDLLAGLPLYRDYFPASASETWPAWTIGLSPRCPEALKRFLHEEGFLAEHSDQATGYSLYLDRPDFADKDALEVLAEIDACKNPLLRLWRWPDGYRSALCISADICAVDLRDFFERTSHF